MFVRCCRQAMFGALFLFSVQAFSVAHLIFAADLIRHGDRTPVEETPIAPYHWPQGLGELTAEGMNQEFKLGVALRARYVEQTHLLPRQYNANTMTVRSTDFNRTLMSAASLLSGLYPLGTGQHLDGAKQFALPQGFQPIPIHTMPQHNDQLLLMKSTGTVYADDQAELKTKLFPYQAKFEQWKAASGFDLKNPKNITKLRDILFIRESHHMPLPKNISQQDAKDIIALGDWIWARPFHHKAEYYPMGHAFLLNLNEAIQQALKSTSVFKYILFSAHDSSIASVMATLGVVPDSLPPYASHLNFAVYEDNGMYKIKISLNDKMLVIPGCSQESCTLDQFVAIANK